MYAMGSFEDQAPYVPKLLLSRKAETVDQKTVNSKFLFFFFCTMKLCFRLSIRGKHK